MGMRPMKLHRAPCSEGPLVWLNALLFSILSTMNKSSTNYLAKITETHISVKDH